MGQTFFNTKKRSFTSLFYDHTEKVDNRGKVCLANGESYVIEPSSTLTVKDVCIKIAKHLNIAPVSLDLFALISTDCQHCQEFSNLRGHKCAEENDHYLYPKRVLQPEECASKVFFFRLVFITDSLGQDIEMLDKNAFQYFVMQCRWDFLRGRIRGLTTENHLRLLLLECILKSHEKNVSCKVVLKNPGKFGLLHLFQDENYSVKEIEGHLKSQICKFKQCMDSAKMANGQFVRALGNVAEFGVTKIPANQTIYNSFTRAVRSLEVDILISFNGLKKRRAHYGQSRALNREEFICDYRDIEYLEIKEVDLGYILHISRKQGCLEVFHFSNESNVKRESLITLIEGFFRLCVNRYKKLTKNELGLCFPKQTNLGKMLKVHGPIERQKAEILLKSFASKNGDPSGNGSHLIRRSRKEFDSYVLSLMFENQFKHFEVVKSPDEQYGIPNGPKFDSLEMLLEFYKTAQPSFPTPLHRYCRIPLEGVCALFDRQILTAPPDLPSRPELTEVESRTFMPPPAIGEEHGLIASLGRSFSRHSDDQRLISSSPSSMGHDVHDEHPFYPTSDNNHGYAKARVVSELQWKWIPISEVHHSKFKEFLEYGKKHPDKIREINGVRVCCAQEFLIGKGCDGTRVFIGLARDGTEKAVKRLPKDVCGSMGSHEKKMLSNVNAMNSQYVVKNWFYDDETDDEYVFLILELCEETLKNYVDNQSQECLTAEAPTIVKQILMGLRDLQQQPTPILHRDLKPSNILRKVNGTWVIADFGISRMLTGDQTTHRSGEKGTRHFRAVETYPPEGVSDTSEVRYKKESDMQVVGMVNFHILTKGDHPFGPEFDRERNLRDGKPVGLDKIADPLANDLISWMVKHEPKKRPSVDEALKHPYLQPPDQQFELLHLVGNQLEVKTGDTSSQVVHELNNDPCLSSMNWKTQINPDVLGYLCTDETPGALRIKFYNDDWTGCLRLIRNTNQHWKDRPCPRPQTYAIVGEPQVYFLGVFPFLPAAVHRVIRSSDWKDRSELTKFFI